MEHQNETSCDIHTHIVTHKHTNTHIYTHIHNHTYTHIHTDKTHGVSEASIPVNSLPKTTGIHFLQTYVTSTPQKDADNITRWLTLYRKLHFTNLT